MSLKIPINKKLNIHLVGAGGTGGYALACLARLLAGGDHTIHVYDGDLVEKKSEAPEFPGGGSGLEQSGCAL